MPATPSQEITVVTQNVLLDYTRTNSQKILPQRDRMDALAATIRAFSDTIDVVGVQEAQKEKTQHYGEQLAVACGYSSGVWFNHNTKDDADAKRGRGGEHIGMFGSQVETATPIDTGDRRLAVLTTIAGIAFVTLHLRSGLSARTLREEQAVRIIEAINMYDDAVVMGDFNEPPIRGFAKARDAFCKSGFQSVFNRLAHPHPVTCPVDSYRDVMSSGRGWQTGFVRHGWSIDDILTRGERTKTIAAGVLKRVCVNASTLREQPFPADPSDHEGVWAKLLVTS